VFYLRFQAVFPAAFIANQSPLVQRGRPPAPDPRPLPRVLIDELEHRFKPLQPHLFDIYTPGDFRKAVAAILREIAR
jgi:hypothetical protein